MIFLGISVQVIELVAAFWSIWRQGGSELVKEMLTEHKKIACDKVCELKKAKEKSSNDQGN